MKSPPLSLPLCLCFSFYPLFLQYQLLLPFFFTWLNPPINLVVSSSSSNQPTNQPIPSLQLSLCRMENERAKLKITQPTFTLYNILGARFWLFLLFFSNNISTWGFASFLSLGPLVRTIPWKGRSLLIREDIARLLCAEEIVLLHFHILRRERFLKLKAVDRRGRRQRRRGRAIEGPHELLLILKHPRWRNSRVRAVILVQDRARVAVRGAVFEVIHREKWGCSKWLVEAKVQLLGVGCS